MAGIDQLLTQILKTKLGKDMRQAIHDSIAQCYDDVTSPELNVKAFEQAVQNKIDSGELATMTIPDGTITVEKLDSDLSGNIDDIPDLKSANVDFAIKIFNLASSVENVFKNVVFIGRAFA